jgi:hypothetical protein
MKLHFPKLSKEARAGLAGAKESLENE